MSVTLSSADLADLGDAVRLIASPLDHGGIDGWRKAVNDQFRSLFHADSAGFLLPVPDGVPFYSDEHPPAEINRYPDTPPPPTAGGVPLFEKVLQIGVGTLDHVFEGALPAYFASAYYNEYAAPNKAHDTFGVFAPLAAPMPGGAAAMASVHLWHDRPTGRLFGDREVALMRLLYPAFRAGAEVAVAWSRRCDDLVDVLDGVDRPAIVADLHGRSVRITPSLASLLAADPDAARLRAGLGAALDALVQSHRGETAVPVRAVRTRTDVYRLHACLYNAAGDRPLAVVGVERASPHLPSVEVLRKRFGLTRRQAEVARLLAQRKSNAEIAGALVVSPHTALRHTEAVFAALGVRDRRRVAGVLCGDSGGDT